MIMFYELRTKLLRELLPFPGVLYFHPEPVDRARARKSKADIVHSQQQKPYRRKMHHVSLNLLSLLIEDKVVCFSLQGDELGILWIYHGRNI